MSRAISHGITQNNDFQCCRRVVTCHTARCSPPTGSRVAQELFAFRNFTRYVVQKNIKLSLDPHMGSVRCRTNTRNSLFTAVLWRSSTRDSPSSRSRRLTLVAYPAPVVCATPSTPFFLPTNRSAELCCSRQTSAVSYPIARL